MNTDFGENNQASALDWIALSSDLRILGYSLDPRIERSLDNCSSSSVSCSFSFDLTGEIDDELRGWQQAGVDGFYRTEKLLQQND